MFQFFVSAIIICSVLSQPCPVLNQETQICCDGIPQLKILGDTCCGRRIYKSNVEFCCENVTVTRAPFECCGVTIYNPVVQTCCDGFPAALGPSNNPYLCCGRQSYNPSFQQCCKDRPQPLGAPSSPLVCCENIVFNPLVQLNVARGLF